MILIADGGTTKCDWVGCFNKDDRVQFSSTTAGINPSYLSFNDITRILEESNDLDSVRDKIDEIYFFGSGCGDGIYQQKLKDVLVEYFSNAKVIQVLSDITGAAYACTDKEGVVGILGTGSNICYFDGEHVEFRIPSLGYILMDQGSGNALGKKLLKGYFFNTMPIKFRKDFEREFNLDLDYVKNRLYDAPGPSTFMATFATFLINHLPDPYMVQMLTDTLEEFFDLSVAAYSDKLEVVPLHFVGSIAYYSKDYIEKICEIREIELGNIIKKPISSLPKKIEFIRQVST